MKKIPKPVIVVNDILTELVQLRYIGRNNNLSDKLINSNSDLVSAEELYLSNSTPNFQLSTIMKSNLIGQIDKSEATMLYEKKLVSHEKLRDKYEYLRSLSPNNICPYCNQRVVSTLDHYLPKADYSQYTVTPINLVPSCKDCNNDSGSRIINNISDQVLHPYFDNFDMIIWLKCRIKSNTNPIVIEYFVNPYEPLISSDISRINKHFEIFGLSLLYSTHAGVEIGNIAKSMKRQINSDSRKLLLRQYADDRRDVTKNNWQAALYEALSESDWYCETGYNLT